MSTLLTMLPFVHDIAHACASCVHHPRTTVPTPVSVTAGAAATAAAAAAAVPSAAAAAAGTSPADAPADAPDDAKDSSESSSESSSDDASKDPAANRYGPHYDPADPVPPPNPYAPNTPPPPVKPDVPTPKPMELPPLDFGKSGVQGPGGTTLAGSNGQYTVTTADGKQVPGIPMPDGGLAASLPDGGTLTINGDHSATLTAADGSSQTWDSNGKFTGNQSVSDNWKSNGASGNAPNPTHDTTVPMNGGGYRVDHPDGSCDIHWPNGSVVHVDPDQVHWHWVVKAP
jgi:hypothetical protein